MLKSTVLKTLHETIASSPGKTEAFLGGVMAGGGSEINKNVTGLDKQKFSA